MSQDDAEGLGRKLLAGGWAPGAIFSLPGASYNITTARREDGHWIMGEARWRSVRESERLVVISHPCDIASESEPYVEALICKKEKPNSPILAKWRRNSARRFVVDESVAWVAQAEHRVKIAKTTLLNALIDVIAPEGIKQRIFMQWLARRFERAVVEDDVYSAIHLKTVEILEFLSQENPERYQAFNDGVSEIRLSVPLEVEPPFRTSFLYLGDGEMAAETYLAIRAVHEMLVSDLAPTTILDPKPTISSVDDVPYGLYLRTQPLFLEYVSSFDGLEGDRVGAPPLWLTADS